MNLFEHGRLTMTRGVQNLVPMNEVVDCLHRHLTGDWGELGEDDIEANKRALQCGERLLSSYMTSTGKVWVITEWDRSATTVLLPGEY